MMNYKISEEEGIEYEAEMKTKGESEKYLAVEA